MMSQQVIFDEETQCYRLRLYPAGGVTAASDWQVLAQLAHSHGDGFIRLGEACVIELRGLDDPESVMDEISGTSLSATSFRICAEPLARSCRVLAQELGSRIANNSGSILFDEVHDLVFGITESSTDALGFRADIHIHIKHSAGTLSLLTEDDTVTIAEGSWGKSVDKALNIVVEMLKEKSLIRRESTPNIAREALPIGWLTDTAEQGCVNLGMGVVEEGIPADHAAMLGLLPTQLSVTPWRGLVIHDLPEADADTVLRFLAPRGFIFDINSPLL